MQWFMRNRMHAYACARACMPVRMRAPLLVMTAAIIPNAVYPSHRASQVSTSRTTIPKGHTAGVLRIKFLSTSLCTYGP